MRALILHLSVDLCHCFCDSYTTTTEFIDVDFSHGRRGTCCCCGCQSLSRYRLTCADWMVQVTALSHTVTSHR